ncbi:MAG: hypothetical protein RMK20_16325, partial [Verrucomicrobiales bacterium]|nr:hypothetical protein [Verrucomicrobiales bacterium]
MRSQIALARPAPQRVVVSSLLAAVLPAVAAASNLLPNPSFEAASGATPREWQRERWGGQANFLYPTAGRTGERAVGLESTLGADVAWAARVPVEPFARYRLAGWIKTENVAAGTGRGALLNVHGLAGAVTRALTGSADWTRVEVEFDAEDATTLQINCLLGGWGLSTGRAWFDDVSLELLERRAPPAPRIRIDATQVREPLSPLIYGQFIEHLGRCIYGGIWAEMLEDRKFYFPITSNYAPYTALRETAFPVVGASPWEIIGAPDNVSMSTNQPFVGRHTPAIRAPGGIRQHDLGVTAGKAYVGYIWVRPTDQRTVELEVSLVWGADAGQRQTVRLRAAGDRYRKLPFRFRAGATTDKATLEIRVTRGTALVGTLSLMPADHVDGLRADTLALLRELRATVYRWPGGNFVSGYDWRDGIGERDRRPPRTNPAWTGVEHNDFGLHEFIGFCRLVDAEPC